jgi:hydrogenase maturation protease
VIFIIGYGNPLRTDDGIGACIAESLEERLDGAAVCVHTAYQLTPEWVEPIRRAALIVFIDARVGDRPGTLIQEVVEPAACAGAFTHHVSPATLLGAAQGLYGVTPKGILISITGANFDFGSGLSSQLSESLISLANQVEAIIRANPDLQLEEKNHHA